MRDNKEGGSPAPGPARQDPARLATPTSEPNLSGPAGLTDLDGEEADGRPVSADMQQFIGRQLRAVFDDVAKQPIPDRFLELMKQLDGKAGAR